MPSTTFAQRLHWLGVAFLFTASLLLLIVTLSAPIINDVGLLKVHLNNGTLTSSPPVGHNSTITFGTFGYCVLRTGPLENAPDYCSPRRLGYSPSLVLTPTTYTVLPDISTTLMRIMVLHPVACILAFLAWLAAAGSGIVRSLIGAIVAVAAAAACLIVMAADFSMWSTFKDPVNKDGSGSHAEYGNGMWMVVGGFLLLVLGMFIVTFTCFAGRRTRRGAGTGP